MTTEEEIALELQRLGVQEAFVVRVDGDRVELRDAPGKGQNGSAVLPAKVLLDALAKLEPIPPETRAAALEAGEGDDMAWEAVWHAVVETYPPAAKMRSLGGRPGQPR